MKIFLFTLILVSWSLCSLNAQETHTRTINVKNKVLIEEYKGEDETTADLWTYSVKEYMDSISIIKETCRQFIFNPYPHYDYYRLRDDGRSLKKEIIEYFVKLGKARFLTRKFSLGTFSYFLQNNGKITPKKFHCGVRLLSFCSPEEILRLFEIVSSHRLYSPIVPDEEGETNFMLTVNPINYPEQATEQE